MVEHKDWGEAEAERQEAMAKGAPEQPESEEFYAEIRRRDSVAGTPEGDIETHSMEEETTVEPGTAGNSKAFEEEMDDL